MKWQCDTCGFVALIPEGVSLSFCPSCGKKCECPRENADSNLKSWKICANCQEFIEPGESYHECTACGEMYHHDCWRALGHCVNQDCTALAADDAPVERDTSPQPAPSQEVCPNSDAWRKNDPSVIPLTSDAALEEPYLLGDETGGYVPVDQLEMSLLAADESSSEIAPDELVALQPQTAATGQVCSICGTDIVAGEETQVCPDCGLVYHADCWLENQGCATYGCKSSSGVDVHLQEGDETAAAAGAPLAATDMSELRECPHCGVKGNAVSPFCWSCGKDYGETVAKTEGTETKKGDNKGEGGVGCFFFIVGKVVFSFIIGFLSAKFGEMPISLCFILALVLTCVFLAVLMYLWNKCKTLWEKLMTSK